MAKLKLGVIVGSNRRESINRKLAQALVRLGADAFEAKFIQIDDLPMYNQDHEQPLPAPVARFKAEVEASDALLFVTPEHNRSIPAVLKNAIDWGGAALRQDLLAGQAGRHHRHLRRRHLHAPSPSSICAPCSAIRACI